MAAVQSSTTAAGADIFAALGLAKKETAAGKGGIGQAQDQFMTLLITQIRNQDPLSPMQNAEFTSQLAQINTVQGIEKLNATLSSLLNNYDSGQAMQAAAMIGQHVLVAGDKLELTSAGGIAGFELQGAAESVKVTIKDGNGLLMKTLELGAATAGPSSFYWDGKTESGEAAVSGNYSFAIEAVKGNDSVGNSALQVGTVNAVTRQGSGFKLDLGSLGDFSFDDVKQIL
jgi:flagellar basal-body rod modification protein FlgD